MIPLPPPASNIIEAKPYAFADYLMMKPGTLLGGFMLPNKVTNTGRKLASDWDEVLQAMTFPGGRKKEYPIVAILEHEVRWRTKLRKWSRVVRQTRLYKPPTPLVDMDLAKTRNSSKFHLPIGQPIGIYLGHIVRCESVSYINVLTGEGFDLWLI